MRTPLTLWLALAAGTGCLGEDTKSDDNPATDVTAVDQTPADADTDVDVDTDTDTDSDTDTADTGRKSYPSGG